MHQPRVGARQLSSYRGGPLCIQDELPPPNPWCNNGLDGRKRTACAHTHTPAVCSPGIGPFASPCARPIMHVLGSSTCSSLHVLAAGWLGSWLPFGRWMLGRTRYVYNHGLRHGSLGEHRRMPGHALAFDSVGGSNLTPELW